MRLSPGTQRRVDLLFPRQDRRAAATLLADECGTGLPFCSDYDGHALERVRFAALKVSDGNLIRLREAVDQAKVDWQDLLVEASFGSDDRAHENWPSAKRARL
jgi:hypothetical protein